MKKDNLIVARPGAINPIDLQRKKYLWIILLGAVIQITLFKLLYPFPDFISDSYNYIESAALHLDVNLWPIGYAKFLWLFHQVTYSDTALVVFQYFLLMASLAYFFFNFLYLYQPSGAARKILFVFLFFNPIFLYLSNCVLSDALFTALSIVWFTQLLRMLRKASTYHIVTLAVLTGLLFTLRYTAAYYPIVAAVVFLLSRQRMGWKVAGILAPAVFMLPFIFFTEAKTKEITGTAEFSVFGGWQIANNALYMYGHIKVDSAELPPATAELDHMVKQYYHWAPPGYFNFEDFPGTFFIKHAEAPLKQYMFRKYRKEQDFGFATWGKVSPIYNTYGKYLIAHHPVAFAQYYLWLNVKNYFSPFLEKFGSYNIGMDSVWPEAKYWFHYKTPAVRAVSKDLQGVIFFSYPPVFMVLNIYFAIAFCWMLFTRRLRKLSPMLRNSLLLTAAFLLINFGFSIFATPIVLRYQILPMIFLVSYSLLLLEYSDKKEAIPEKKKGESFAVKQKAQAAVTYCLMGALVILGALYCALLLIADLVFKGITMLLLSVAVLTVLCGGFIRRKYLLLTRKHQAEQYA